jgi:hypothetical protein
LKTTKESGHAGEEVDILEDHQWQQPVVAVEEARPLGHLRHLKSGLGEAFAPVGADHRLDVRADDDFNPECVGDTPNGAIVMGRSDAAGGDDHVVLRRARGHLGCDACAVIADDDDPLEVDAELGEEIDEQRCVGVANLGAQDLVADDDRSGGGH